MCPFSRIMDWLVTRWQWPAACLFAAFLLLVLLPAWYSVAGLALAAVYIQLPMYLLHQGEEHLGDRFRHFVNEEVFGGREALTPTATFWINALGVWGLDLVALYLAVFVRPGLGLMAVYLALLNSLGHLLPGIARRKYNPGLYTSLVLFIPLGCASWYVLEQAGASSLDHLIGIAVALGVHLAIIAHVAWHLKHSGRRTAETASATTLQTTAHG